MNSTVPGPNMLSSVLPASAGSGRSTQSATESSGELIDFKNIIKGEMLTPEGMAKLQELLPPDQLNQLESLLDSGNALPFSADIADPASMLNNPSLLQWMLQLAGADGAGDAVMASPGAQAASGEAITVADLRDMLLRQGAGGSTANVTAGSAGRSLNPTETQTALLLTKGEIPADSAAFKPGFITGELSAGLLNSNGVATATPLAAVVSGLEQISTQRAEVYTPPAITLPAGEKGWDNMLGNRVMWAVGNQLQQASVHITPRHLGPIDIQVSIQHDQTSVSFLANNAMVKEAIEAAIPRLREMFADNNMQLVNVDVGQRDAGSQDGGAGLFQQAGAGGGEDFAAGGRQPGAAGSPVEAGEAVRMVTSNGLVDDYA